MPVIDPGSTLFGAFSPGSEFISAMPSGEAGRSGALAVLMQRPEFVEPYLRNFGNVVQHTAANVAITQGIVSTRIPSFGKIFSEWPRAVAGDLSVAARNGAIRGALKIWDGALTSALSDVPLVGLVVDVGVLIYKWVKAIQEARREKKPPPSPAIVFSQLADQDALRGFLTRLGVEDWTEFFMPLTTSPRFEVQEIAWSGDSAQGRRVTIGIDRPEGTGLLPGIADMIGDYQYPFKQLPSSRPAMPSISLETWGKFFPSSVQFGMGTWEMVLKASPQMFNIDPDKIANGWESWYGHLSEFRDQHTGQLKSMMDWAIKWKGKYRNLNPKNVGPTTGDLVRYVIDRLYMPRAKNALRYTVTCAYVPPSAPALRNSSLSNMHDDMRRRLLEHKAVDEVELDMVPDSDYREAVRIAQLRTQPPLTAKPGDDQPFIATPIFFPDATEPPKNPGPAVEGTGGSGALILVGAAAAVALALGLRR